MPPSDAVAEAQILACYRSNAQPWIDAVRRGQIESRRLVTDRAILDAIQALRPARVLDLGCGEGWLSRALQQAGSATLGVDAIEALVVAARAADPAGDYRVLDYAGLVRGGLAERVDLVVANFSLFGAAELETLLAYLPRQLLPGGRLLIQTLHPLQATGEAPYAEGWRSGSWAGFAATFRDPAPWYFRTLAGWIAILHGAGWQLQALREPLHPQTGRPASLILQAGMA